MKWLRSVTSEVMTRAPLWVAALWWASLTTVGFLVVPLLFTHLPTPALAGGMAARLFSAQTGVSTFCGLFLLLQSRSARSPALDFGARSVVFFALSGLLLALLAEFVVAPKIVARENLRLWHSVGSVMYLLQWGCATVAFWKLTPPGRMDQV